MTTLVASRDGVRIALHELGAEDGRPVLVVHGFSSSAQRNWLDAGWDRAFADAGLRGIAMDLRGHGDSDRPEHGYAVERFIEDVDAVLEHTGVERPGYLGYSMGARLGWRYAASHPDALAALVLGGLPVGDPFQGLDVEAARAAVASGEPAEGPAGFVVRLASALPENDVDALVSLAGEVAETPFDPQERLELPTLLMTGDRDDHAPDTQELLPQLSEGAFEPIPGRNHINAITSRAFKRHATAFLAEHVG